MPRGPCGHRAGGSCSGWTLPPDLPWAVRRVRLPEPWIGKPCPRRPMPLRGREARRRSAQVEPHTRSAWGLLLLVRRDDDRLRRSDRSLAPEATKDVPLTRVDKATFAGESLRNAT